MMNIRAAWYIEAAVGKFKNIRMFGSGTRESLWDDLVPLKRWGFI